MIELSSRLVTWKIGDDVVLLYVMPGGFYQGDIFFYHTSSDCSGVRYLTNYGGTFAYDGYMSGSTVFYTRLADPLTLNSYELVKAGDDPTAQGVCTAAAMEYPGGAAISVTDPALGAFVAPFRLK